LHLKRLFDNAGLPTTKPRDSALRAVTKEVVGLHVLLTGSLFGDDILRMLLLRVSLAKPARGGEKIRQMRRFAESDKELARFYRENA
jgi:hypothetical protein